MRQDAEPPSVDLPVHVGHPLVGTDWLPSEVARVPATCGDHRDVTINPHAANVLGHRIVAELATLNHVVNSVQVRAHTFALWCLPPDDFRPRFRYHRLSIVDRVDDNRERNRERNANALRVSRGDGADHHNSGW